MKWHIRWESDLTWYQEISKHTSPQSQRLKYVFVFYNKYLLINYKERKKHAGRKEVENQRKEGRKKDVIWVLVWGFFLRPRKSRVQFLTS